MKKNEIIASEYANKLIAYEGIINESFALINKYNRELEEKENLKKRFLKRKKKNKDECLELEKKCNKVYKILSTICLLYPTVGNAVFVHLAAIEIFRLWVVPIFVLTEIILFVISLIKANACGKELNSSRKKISDDEEQESDLDNEINKLRKKIDDLERVNQITREKADIVREALNQIEEQISLEEQPSFGLQTPQVIVPKQVVASQQTSNSQPKIGKERKISLW